MREYSLGVDKKEMRDIYEDATSDKMNFLLLDLEGPKEKRFRSGLNEFYEINSEKM
jgi:hypothetical protein